MFQCVFVILFKWIFGIFFSEIAFFGNNLLSKNLFKLYQKLSDGLFTPKGPLGWTFPPLKKRNFFLKILLLRCEKIRKKILVGFSWKSDNGIWKLRKFPIKLTGQMSKSVIIVDRSAWTNEKKPFISDWSPKTVFFVLFLQLFEKFLVLSIFRLWAHVQHIKIHRTMYEKKFFYSCKKKV